MPPFRIATRSSPLALWQANHVAGLLAAAGWGEAELVYVVTTGDRDRQHSLASFGGMGVFTREVQRAVLDGRADLAVHSLKDLPTEPVAGLVLAAVPERASRDDLLVLPATAPPADRVTSFVKLLPENALIGTGSPRRRSQLLRWRPDLRVDDIRGNVETRLRKLDDGEFDAIVLAEAGLSRLELLNTPRTVLTLSVPRFYPAVGQGALGLECRTDDPTTCDALALLNDRTAWAETAAERAALAGLRAGCHAPVGTLAGVRDDRVTIAVIVLSLDGRKVHIGRGGSAVSDPEAAGRQAAEELRQSGAAAWL